MTSFLVSIVTDRDVTKQTASNLLSIKDFIRRYPRCLPSPVSNVICAGVNYLMRLGHPRYQSKKVERNYQAIFKRLNSSLIGSYCCFEKLPKTSFFLFVIVKLVYRQTLFVVGRSPIKVCCKVLLLQFLCQLSIKVCSRLNLFIYLFY